MRVRLGLLLAVLSLVVAEEPAGDGKAVQTKKKEKPTGGGGLANIDIKILRRKPVECEGLVEKMCTPCPFGTEDEHICKTNKAQCMAEFCLPLCRRITWTCKINFKGFDDEAEDEKYSKGLCSQFYAYGCQKMMKCCPLDELLYNYVDDNMFFDQTPNPKFPSPNCLEGPSDELCSACKKAVEVKLKPGNCPFPMLGGGKAKAGKGVSFLQTAPEMAGDMSVAGLTSHQEAKKKKRNKRGKASPIASLSAVAKKAKRGSIIPTPHRGSTPLPAGVKEQNKYYLKDKPWQYWLDKDRDWQKTVRLHFLQSMARTPSGAEKGGAKNGPKEPCGPGVEGWPDCEADTSIGDRCEALLKKVKPKLGSMESEFQAKACACLGCCKGGCYYPALEEFPPGGEEAPQ